MNDLTDHFNSREFVVSSSHPELLQEIRDSVNDMDLYKFFLLARMILEPLREWVGLPIKIYSGKRSEALNKAVGGAINSDHLYRDECAAVDFTFGDPSKDALALLYLRARPQILGQCINYPVDGKETFIHVSLASRKHHGEYLQKQGNGFIRV